MINLCCLLIGHRWHHRNYWEPHFYAPIVTYWKHTSTCTRCGKQIVKECNFNPKTGEPIDDTKGIFDED